MAKKVIKTTFQVRRALKATWEKLNPVLAYGEPGFERETYKLKIGDGSTPWVDLPYVGGTDSKEGNLIADSDNGYVYIKNENGDTIVVAEISDSIGNDAIKGLFD